MGQASSPKEIDRGSADKMRFLALAAASSAAVFSVILAWPRAGTAVNPGPATNERFVCTVTKVHDGDGPIWCAEGPRIRLTAVAARELDETCSPGHPCPDASGASARQALERLALGETLQCEKTGTSYNRVTAWCWRDDGVELNCAMVEGGWAARWDRYDPQNRMCR